MQALDRVLGMTATQLGVMVMDWQKLAAFLPKATLAHRLSSVIGPSSAEQQGEDGGSHIREILRQANPQAREEILQTYVQDQVARVLGTATAKLDTDRPLTELGLDSLMGVELKNRIERDLAVSLPTHELLEGPTIKKLAKLAFQRVGATAASPSVPEPAPNLTGEQAMAVVEKLTDEEVDSLLDQLVDDQIDETHDAKEMSP
jgi:epothilone polyketide synthase D